MMRHTRLDHHRIARDFCVVAPTQEQLCENEGNRFSSEITDGGQMSML
jgi:hypothetical protein